MDLRKAFNVLNKHAQKMLRHNNVFLTKDKVKIKKQV